MTLPIADSPLWNKSIWTALDSRVASNEVGFAAGGEGPAQPRP